jgi:branched-subunit amino acid transport protein
LTYLWSCVSLYVLHVYITRVIFLMFYRYSQINHKLTYQLTYLWSCVSLYVLHVYITRVIFLMFYRYSQINHKLTYQLAYLWSCVSLYVLHVYLTRVIFLMFYRYSHSFRFTVHCFIVNVIGWLLVALFKLRSIWTLTA